MAGPAAEYSSKIEEEALTGPREKIRFRIVTIIDEETEGLGRWISEILVTGVHEAPDKEDFEIVGETKFLERAGRGYLECCRPERHMDTTDDVVLLVVACFMDGMSADGKKEFLELKTWAIADPMVTIQAINGKNGEHNYWTRKLDIKIVQGNLATTVSRKLKGIERRPKKSSKTTHLEPQPDQLHHTPEQHPTTPFSAASSSPASTPPEPPLSLPPASHPMEPEPANYLDLSVDRLSRLCESTLVRLRENQREHTMKIGIAGDGTQEGVQEDQLQDNLDVIKKIAVETGCGMKVTATKKLPKGKVCCEVLLRMDSEDTYIDMRVAICGNVDSGKSTLTGVLTRGTLDDGRGLVRAKIFNHKHEQDTGRTSSVSEQYLGFDANGDPVNYASWDGDSPSTTQKVHKLTAKELSGRSAKVITLYDLAGHEKYLKTTVQGITGSVPDYACIVISANNGIQRMTKEHLGLCLALRIPFFVVVTRMDSTPAPVIKATMESITKMLKLPTVRKLPYLVKNEVDVVICAKNLKNDKITPVFQVSNVTGENINKIINFLNISPIRRDWASLATEPKELIIDSTFYVSGVGTVVGGIITKGTFKVNDSLFIGPNGNGQFRPVQIKSIQVKGLDVHQVEAGHDAAIALKKEKRSAVRKGNVLLEYTPKAPPMAYREFSAEIIVLYHSTTIKSKYEPVIHCSTIRQSAKITLFDTDLLRTGDKARVCFKFLYRPEYLTIGAKLVFREGRTKGLGTVTGLRNPTTKEWMGSGYDFEPGGTGPSGGVVPVSSELHADDDEKPV